MTRTAFPALILLLAASCAAPKPAAIHTGMTLGEIEKHILAAGGHRVEGTYPLVWKEETGRAGVYVYFELPDRTWLQARVETIPSGAATEGGCEVIRFELGQRGLPYFGQLQWAKDGALHNFPMKIELADYVYLEPPSGLR